MPGIDFAEVKRMVTMRDLLAHYNVPMRCPNPARPEQLKGNCPLPTHNHDRKESFNVNLEKNCWSCWSKSCLDNRHGKGGSVLDFVVFMEECRLFEAAQKILDWFGTKKQNPPMRTEGFAKTQMSNSNLQCTKPILKPQLVISKKEDTSLIDWLEKSPAEYEGHSSGGAGGQPVQPDATAQAESGQKPHFMKEIDKWFDDLVKRGNETDVEYWQRVRNSVKAKLIESYKNGRKEVARTA